MFDSFSSALQQNNIFGTWTLLNLVHCYASKSILRTPVYSSLISERILTKGCSVGHTKNQRTDTASATYRKLKGTAAEVAWIPFWGRGGGGFSKSLLFRKPAEMTRLKGGRFFSAHLCHHIYIFISFVPHHDIWNHFFPYANGLGAASLRCLAVGLLTHRPSFSRRQLHVGIFVGKVQLEKFLSEEFGSFLVGVIPP
jgi:hypothetical protein